MSKGWTPDRRARQAELIRTWKPWENATGPQSVEGKARSARNADKGGIRRELRELRKALNALFRDQSDLVDGLGGRADNPPS
jgi:hypothetical protein